MREKGNALIKSTLTVIMSVALMLTMLSFVPGLGTQEASAETIKLNNPVRENGVTTWDCVYFGRYKQSSDGKGGFKTEPIKWRVLNVNGDEALLLSDKNIDGGIRYNEIETDITWKDCTVRSWLNGTSDGNFMNKAFTPQERNAIADKTIANTDNPVYGTPGGEDTTDKVFLLSYEEVTNPDYGFEDNKDYSGDGEYMGCGASKTREAADTAYTASKSESMYVEGDAESWNLRSPGHLSYYCGVVAYDGSFGGDGSYVDDDRGCVRPALYLNLKAENLYQYAGTVNSEGVAKTSEINPEKVSMLTPKVGRRYMTVKWKKVSGGVYYQVGYRQKGSATWKYTGSRTTSKTITKLKSRKYYYVKVRAYKKVSKVKYYGEWSAAKRVKIK